MTIRRIAQINGYSKSTVFKDLTERLPKINISLYQKVRHVLEYHDAVKHIRGGEATAESYKKEGV
jgi:putative DeoR family transcriptional regulator (stage III sporulation protein D)